MKPGEPRSIEERLALLERRADHERDVRDNLDSEVAAIELLMHEFFMPAVLLLAGHGFRPQLRELLATTEVRMNELEPFPRAEIALAQLRHWRQVVDGLPAWLGVQPRPPVDQ